MGDQYSAGAIADRIAGTSGAGGVQYEGQSLGGNTGHSAPGHTTGRPTAPSSFPGYENQGLNTSIPPVKDVGLSTGGQATTDKVKEINGSAPQHTSGAPTTATQATSRTEGTAATSPQGVVQQTVEAVQAAATRAQEASQPYIQKIQETTGPYVNTAVEKASPALNQAKEYAAQGYNNAAAELDKRGVNREVAQQKLADVGQNLKNIGVVGQERAGDYLQQAVEQAKTIGSDRENKNIIATIFGTITLIWLAFGFGLGALLALGIAGTIAAILSRYSTRATSTGPGTAAHGTTRGTSNPGVETHYPNPGHPDNTLNLNK